MPARNPTEAGMTDIGPVNPDISMLGMSSDHTEAATITPEAKPSSVRSSSGDICPRMKNTNAEPSTVPNSGKRRMMIKPVAICSEQAKR